MNIGVNLNSPASLALALWSFEARHWPGSLAVKVLDDIFLQYKTVASILEIHCLVLSFSPQGALDSLGPCGLQHARLPCPSLSPGVCLDSCPLSWRSHPTISSSFVPFSFCPQSFWASGSFPDAIGSALALHWWPKYWSFSFSISLSNEYSGLISFRIDWFDLLAVQGTLRSLLQHHNSIVSILWCSAFFMVQLSHPYMTTGKTIALTRWTFVGKVISLLSRFDIAFLPRRASLIAQLVKNPPAVQETPNSVPGSGRSAGEGIGYPSIILGLPLWLSW